MTTISFNIENERIAEICAILNQYGVKNLTSKESLPKHLLEDIKESLDESNQRKVTPSHLVHQEMRKKCTK